MHLQRTKSGKRKQYSAFRYALLGGICTFALGFGAIISPGYGQDQDAPESLLPPGFGQPEPAPEQPSQPVQTAPANPDPVEQPTPPLDNNQPAVTEPAAPTPAIETQTEPESVNAPPVAAPAAPPAPRDVVTEIADDLVANDLAPSRLPSRAQRSLKQVGLIGTNQSGFPATSLVDANGVFLTGLLNGIDKPIISRWGHILLRRALVTRFVSPRDSEETAWIAARSRLLLDMGEGVLAKHLVQEVDASRYAGRLFDVAREAALASGDLTAFCPIASGGAAESDEVEWQLIIAICSAMSGNSSSATAQIDRASNDQIAADIDLILAEKVVGAGVNGRRAVSVEWDGVEEITSWRFGLATATGITPPDALFEKADRRYHVWRALNPSVTIDDRVSAAYKAAAIGGLSNSAIVDLFSAAYAQPDLYQPLRPRTALLREAYTLREIQGRVAAMRQLWNSNDDPLDRYGTLVLTARAAASIPVMSEFVNDSDQLIASMLSAGLDRNAQRWSSVVQTGSKGWALLQVGTASQDSSTSESDVREYYDNDSSTGQRSAAFLVAGLAGMGRLADEAANVIAEDNGFVLSKESAWERNLKLAANAKNAALVVMLSAAGMQGDDWSQMAPSHLYQIVKALNAVGLGNEARMIAAEAVARA